jgi:hypothetical protein
MSGEVDSERLDQQAMQQAVQSKAQQQQGSNAPAKAMGQSGQKKKKAQQKKPPRSVGNLKQELITRPAQDIAEGLMSFFDIAGLLDIDSTNDTPEDQARKKKMHQRWQQLTKAEQKVAREKYQKELKKKQEEEKRKQMEKKKQQQQKQQNIAPPSSTSKKPGLFIGGKSKKKKSMNRLQQQRQTMGTLVSPN